MRKHLKHITLILSLFLVTSSCKKEDEKEDDNDDQTEEPQLVFKVKIDDSQERLNNLGEPSGLPEGHAAQSPRFNNIAAHYIELTPTEFVKVGDGEVIYHAPETTAGGEKAVDFEKSNLVKDGEIMFQIPLKDVASGTYEYARVSVVYQNYDIDFTVDSDMDLKATLASFVGFNTYLTSYQIKDLTDEVYGNKEQGYWAWETHPNDYFNEPQMETGQAPGTTVPNPIASTSPIPPGSCLVTGKFVDDLIISGDETSSITVELSFSVNNSFEWKDANENGRYEPLDGDTCRYGVKRFGSKSC